MKRGERFAAYSGTSLGLAANEVAISVFETAEGLDCVKILSQDATLVNYCYCDTRVNAFLSAKICTLFFFFVHDPKLLTPSSAGL